MSYTVVPQNAANVIVGATSIAFFLSGPPRIRATGVGTGCRRGDAAVVSGSTSNDRVYIVLNVIDANQIEVYPAPFVEPAFGTVAIHAQNHKLRIVDEATITAAGIAAAVPDTRMFRRTARTPAGGSPSHYYDIYSFLFRIFEIDRTVAGTSILSSSREIWYLDWDGLARSSSSYSSHWRITTSNSGNGEIHVNIGSLVDSGDIRSAANGSVFINGCVDAVTPGSDLQTNLLGSFIGGDVSATFLIDDGPGQSVISNCLYYGNLQAPTGGATLDAINNLTYVGAVGGLPIVGDVLSARKLTVVDSTASGAIALTSTEVRVEDLEISDAVATPLVLLIGSAVNFLNPVEPYSDTELFNAFSQGAGRISYTFNPQFVAFDENHGPILIDGAKVTIEKVSDGHVVDVVGNTDGTYTITINGVDASFIASGNTIAQIQTGLAGAINSSGLGVVVTALIDAAPTQFGTAPILITSDIDNTVFTIEVSAPSNNLVLDPVPSAGGATELGDDYLSGEIVGSPFTTDSNGRINTSGVELSRFITYTPGATFNFFYRVTVEKVGFVTLETTLTLNRPFEAQFPVKHKRTGVL